MAISRSARITLLLVIDILFFFIELIVGYAVGSLALIADSFHMLNDVMSLIVALYAIKLTASSSADSRYSYGWHRAEILAALINGVFLLALCFSISLEALERFFNTQEISNPKLVVIVGSLGLASNIVGLFLFHEHGHAHAHNHHSKPPSITKPSRPASLKINVRSPQTIPAHARDHTRTPSQSEFGSLYGHPAATRASLVQAAHEMAHARSPSPTVHRHSSSLSRPSLDVEPTTPTPFNNRPMSSSLVEDPLSGVFSSEESPLLRHEQDNGTHGHSHSHAGSMNMRALVLHVMGDALGNVGVIAAGLIIWLTEWKFKYYCDPIISLVITIIIFSSALPLVRSASFILLQGVPPTISLEGVRDSILEVDGVISVHELHVWQLSESKVIASVHVLTSRDHDFMPIAVKIRKALHYHGIHSSTIQPEYLCPGINMPNEGSKINEETSCLIVCPPDQACDPTENACCPPPSIEA